MAHVKTGVLVLWALAVTGGCTGEMHRVHLGESRLVEETEGETVDGISEGIVPPAITDPVGGETDPMGMLPSPPLIDGSQTDAPPEAPGTSDMCGDTRLMSKVFYGTLEPVELPLTPGQVMAVGEFNGCTGLLIAPQWVLSAEHCGLRSGSRICFGANPSDADICFTATDVYDAPQRGDMTLLKLNEDVTQAIPEIVPIPILTQVSVDSSWVGRIVEAAGYGQMENGGSGTRKFTAEPISSVWDDMLTIDGEGRHGVCFGDSGGPVMTVADDGTVRTIGVLSNGDGSCVGKDNFTRVDYYRDWIEGHTGVTIIEDAGCGVVDSVGRCGDGSARWCDNDELRTEICDGQTTCGWSDDAGGFRCIDGENPCGGVDLFGVCQGQVATWCDHGVLRRRDCGQCQQVCGEAETLGAVYCNDDPCFGLDYQGQCNGQVVEYCKNGEYKTRDCSDDGLACVWTGNELGYWCE
jgi:hypothetical protein